MKNTHSYDIIVVGSGLAGLTAAIRAAELGNKVLVVEKMPVCGGTSSVSVGAFAVCRSEAQRRNAIKDSEELFLNDIISCGENNIPALARMLATASGRAFRFLKGHGAEYSDKLFSVDGHSVSRCFQPPVNLGVNVIEPLLAAFQSMPCTKLMINTKVGGLLRNAEGAVTGIRTANKDIEAAKGVIIAAGGFSRDALFRHHDRNIYKNIPTYTSKGADSETLQMLITEGAETCHIEYIRFGTSIAFNDIEKGVLIDIKTGKRFVSESAPHAVLTDAILKTSADRDWAILILDANTVKRISNDDKLENMLAKGEMQRFSSLNKLADFFSVDTKSLCNTIYEYNMSIASGTDTTFMKNFAKSGAEAIDTAPFYACPVYIRLNYTQGGVLINENAQVLSKSGEIIKGLYAAGEVTGGVHGKVRLTGCSTVDCAVFGLIAAESAASGAGM